MENLREQLDQHLAEGEWTRAQAVCEQLWQTRPAASLAGFLNGVFERLRDKVPLAPCRVAILRSFTVEPVVPALKVSAFVRRLNPQVTVGGFNTYAQEILDPASKIYSDSPDVIILAIQTRDIAPELWDEFARLSASDVKSSVDRVTQAFDGWIRTLRSRTNAQVLVHSLETPAFPNAGTLDFQGENGQQDAIRAINDALRSTARSVPGVYVLDYDSLVARYGRESWHDPTRWTTINLPMRAEYTVTLADEWVRYLCPLVGKVSKVLVTDLDNTLWGGVIGEDGMNGIRLGQDHVGYAFRAVQRVLLDCSQRGILLAICSKNNPDDARRVFAEHPDMLLKLEHFSAERINWTNKAENLRSIAKELNLGLDSLAFLDDNPAERELIRLELPEVSVIELPAEPIEYAKTIRDCPALQRLTVSQEDAERGRYYSEQRLRTTLEQSAPDLESYYAALQQTIEIEPLSPANLQRVAQLTQKTNQFNLTTKRYTEQALSQLAANPGANVYALRVTDRFGDNGITGVAITCDREGSCEIDTLLLSCRVLGRTVETAFLSFLAGECKSRGVERLEGCFIPTKKNAPAADVYSKHGFETCENGGAAEVGTRWTLDLRVKEIANPPWINLIVRKPEYAAA
jgi:FkbH-like protein